MNIHNICTYIRKYRPLHNKVVLVIFECHRNVAHLIKHYIFSRVINNACQHISVYVNDFRKREHYKQMELSFYFITVIFLSPSFDALFYFLMQVLKVLKLKCPLERLLLFFFCFYKRRALQCMHCRSGFVFSFFDCLYVCKYRCGYSFSKYICTSKYWFYCFNRSEEL